MAGGSAEIRYNFCQALFMKILKVPGKVRKHRTPLLPGTFYENIKSAWEIKEVKSTFLPGTFYENIKRAWEITEVKDTFLPGIVEASSHCTEMIKLTCFTCNSCCISVK